MAYGVWNRNKIHVNISIKCGIDVKCSKVLYYLGSGKMNNYIRLSNLMMNVVISKVCVKSTGKTNKWERSGIIKIYLIKKCMKGEKGNIEQVK